MIPELEFHPLADRFPMMGELEFNALKSDIQQHGLREPIVLFEGKILDGRNRYNVCKELGLDSIKIEEFQGSYQEADDYTMSLNLVRRDLSKSQKAMLLAKSGRVARPHNSKGDAGRMSIRNAGEKYGVNHMLIYKSFFVLEEDPNLAEKVLHGEISVGRAEGKIRNAKQPTQTIRLLEPTAEDSSNLAVSPPVSLGVEPLTSVSELPDHWGKSDLPISTTASDHEVQQSAGSPLFVYQPDGDVSMIDTGTLENVNELASQVDIRLSDRREIPDTHQVYVDRYGIEKSWQETNTAPKK